MKPCFRILISVLIFLSGIVNVTAQLPKEEPLWPDGIPGNPFEYKEEKLTVNEFLESSLSQSNRVFSFVSVPTYIIHKAAEGTANGVAMVICPGGGFRDVWIDRELHIYSKGSHGFDSGIGRGYAVSTWRDSFIAWLKDGGFIKDSLRNE